MLLLVFFLLLLPSCSRRFVWRLKIASIGAYSVSFSDCFNSTSETWNCQWRIDGPSVYTYGLPTSVICLFSRKYNLSLSQLTVDTCSPLEILLERAAECVWKNKQRWHEVHCPHGRAWCEVFSFKILCYFNVTNNSYTCFISLMFSSNTRIVVNWCWRIPSVMVCTELQCTHLLVPWVMTCKISSVLMCFNQ